MEIQVLAVHPKGEERKAGGVRSVTIKAIEGGTEYVIVFVRKRIRGRDTLRSSLKTQDGYSELGHTPTWVPNEIFKAMARRAGAIMFER